MEPLKQLIDLASQLLKEADTGQQYTMEYVIKRLETALDEYPHDSVIRSVAAVINKQSDNGKLITSQKELYSVFNRFAGMNANSMIKEAIGDILYPFENEKKGMISNETAYSYRPESAELNFKIEHNPLEDLFDKNKAAGTYYNTTLAKLGKNIISQELLSIGVPATEIKVVAGVGNDAAIVFDVAFTNKLGTAHVPMFVEVSGEVTPPTHFYGNNQFIELTAENLNKYIVEKAQLEILPTVEKNSGIKTSSMSLLQSFAFEEDAPAEIKVDRVKMPEALKDFAAFEEAVIESSTGFSTQLVRTAKALCARELANMGQNAQITVSEATDNCIICSAELNSAVGKVEIKLPVEIINDRPQIPALFYNENDKDKIYDFSKNEISNYLSAAKIDKNQIMRYSNDFFNMTYGQLKEEIMDGAANKDYLRAEQALSRIEDKFGSSYHMAAMSDYAKYLSHTSTPEKNVQHKCKLLIVKGSVEPRCGHYNVTISRVITNNKGECELIERKAKYENLAESSGALLRTNKITLT